MKPFKALLLTSLVLGACEKSNDITQLHEEAVATAKWYAPRVDDMMKRRDAIFQRGRNVPGNLPDVPEVVKLIGEAGEKLNEMKAIVTPAGDGKSSLEKQADQLQKDAKIDELRKLIGENRDKLDEDWTVVNDDLTHVEGWLWHYEQAHTNTGPVAVAPPLPTATNIGQPPPAAASLSNSAPEAAGSAATEAPKPEETPAAPTDSTDKAGAGSAAEPKAGEKAAAPKAEDKKAAPKAGGGSAAEPKAATPKAEPKAAAPKAGAGSAAAPKAAAPKAGAGSAAK